MPYVDQEARAYIELEGPYEIGDLNYAITKLLMAYMVEWGECYVTYNDMIGALECAKLELYRRMCAPYEDRKCMTNGDVYEIPPRKKL